MGNNVLCYSKTVKKTHHKEIFVCILALQDPKTATKMALEQTEKYELKFRKAKMGIKKLNRLFRKIKGN